MHNLKYPIKHYRHYDVKQNFETFFIQIYPPPNAPLALKIFSIIYKNTSIERVEETMAALPK